MSLAARRSTRLREDFVIRLGCFLVSFAVLASLILEPPRAKAFAMTSSAVTALAGGFLNACGLAPVVSGMSSSGEVNESLARLLQDFLNEEVGGISVADWALSFGEIGLAVKDKKIVIPKPFAEKLGEFATWVAGKYGTKPGMNVVYNNSSFGIPLADGTVFYYSLISFSDGFSFQIKSLGTEITGPIYFANGYYIGLSGDRLYLYNPNGASVKIVATNFVGRDYHLYLSYNLTVMGSYGYPSYYPYHFIHVSDSGSLNSGAGYETAYWGESVSIAESLTLDVAATMQEVLDRLTALEEGQSIALDVGATQSMEIQEILQGILDAILAGDLAASAEIVDEAMEPVDPDPPVVPVVPEGLDKLGAALTSRFPFSIPWDVYKGVTLLAAPPKAPYFEVDFMAPIADRVGGWQGSTKIVLDFSEYEIIGQVCRWTSTIGFCLMLASGTKRLIWTA